MYDVPDALKVVEYLTDAVYLTWSYEGTAGLWRFDTATHTLVKLTERSPVWATDGNVLWSGSANPTESFPPKGPGAWPDQVDRVDLRSGTSETWLYRPQSSTSVVMTDAAGSPVVWIDRGREISPGVFAQSGAGELVLLDSPGHAITLHAGAKSDVQPGAVDDKGMWLGGTVGVFVLTPTGDFIRVSTAVAVPAGGCQ